MDEIKANVLAVKKNIAEAALRSGRRPEDILLVAASKMNDENRIHAARDAGVGIFGENRVQEMTEKAAKGAYEGAELHFIGHLQRNKVKQVVGLASVIHSVDSEALLSAIDAEAEKRGLVQQLLLEVNIGAEPAKSGFSPVDIPRALEFASGLKHIYVSGLMAVPPICLNSEENRPYFEAMRQLFIDNGEKKYDNVSMDFLSMGMSGDYMTAIDCGANIVRVGSAIFGKRNYNMI